MNIDYQTEQPTPDARAQLDALRIRYDTAKMPPAIYEVVKQLETELAWNQHNRRTR
jgi:hypothetical protein